MAWCFLRTDFTVVGSSVNSPPTVSPASITAGDLIIVTIENPPALVRTLLVAGAP